MTTAQKTWITIALTVAVGTGIYEARQASVWRAQVGELQQQQAQSARQIQRLQQERDQATQQLAQRSGASSNPNADKDRLELLRLRGEVAMLRQRTNLSGATAEAGAGGGAGSSASQKPANFPRDSWTYAGLATPEDALKSFMWAKSRGDTKVAFSTATPELKEQIKDFYFKGKSDEEIASLMSDSAKNQTGFQIVKRMDAADDQVILQIHIDGSPAKAYSLLTMQKQAEEWRVSAVEERPDGE